MSRFPVIYSDAHLPGSVEYLPPAIILDYFYGVAAYQTQRSDPAKINAQMWILYEAHHQLLSHRESSRRPTTYSPSGEEEMTRSEELRQGEFDILDRMNLGLMLLRYTPEELAAKLQKQRDEGELR